MYNGCENGKRLYSNASEFRALDRNSLIGRNGAVLLLLLPVNGMTKSMVDFGSLSMTAVILAFKDVVFPLYDMSLSANTMAGSICCNRVTHP